MLKSYFQPYGAKKKLFDLDKDIKVISEQESGTDTGFVRYCIAFWYFICDPYLSQSILVVFLSY